MRGEVPRPLPPTTAPRAVGLGAIELLLFGRHVSEAGKEDAAERNQHLCCRRKRSKATERIRGPAGEAVRGRGAGAGSPRPQSPDDSP